MNKKRHVLLYVLIGFAGLCVFCIGVGIGIRQAVNTMTASPLRKALPSTAQDIREWAWEEAGDVGQDHRYLLKAKITQQEFYQYVDKLGLTPHTPTRQYSHGFYPSWTKNEKLDWWKPSDDLSGTYVYDGDSAWTYAKYENGYVFVVSCNV